MRISDAAKAAEELRALKAGKQVRVVSPFSSREIHRNRIGKLVSIISSYYSIKFGDGDEIKFYANELEIVTTPTALSYLKDNLY